MGEPVHFLLQRNERAVAAVPQLPFQAGHVFVVHAVREESRERPLAQHARTVVHLHFHVGEPLHDRFGGDQPSDAQSGSQRFGRAAERDDHAGLIEGLQRRQRGIILEIQVAVGAVLDDRQSAVHGKLDQFMPAFVAHGDACRIVIGRNRVQDRIAFAVARVERRRTAGVKLPFRQQAAQCLHVEAVVVHRHAFQMHAGRLEHLQRLDVARRFRVYGGAGRQQAHRNHLQRLQRAGCDQHLACRAVDAGGAHVRRDGLAQFGQAFGRRVAERFDLVRRLAEHLPPHGFRKEPRVELAGADARHVRRELVPVDGLDGVVVGFEEAGIHVIGPVGRARQHQRPRVADDSRARSMLPFDDAIIGQLVDGRDDGGPVHAEPFGERALRRQTRANRPIAAVHLFAHVPDDLFGDGFAGGTVRFPIDVQRRDACHDAPSHWWCRYGSAFSAVGASAF